MPGGFVHDRVSLGLLGAALLPWAPRSTPSDTQERPKGPTKSQPTRWPRAPPRPWLGLGGGFSVAENGLTRGGCQRVSRSVSRGPSGAALLPWATRRPHVEATSSGRRTDVERTSVDVSTARSRHVDRRGVFPVCEMPSRRGVSSGLVLVAVPRWEPVVVTPMLRPR